MNCLKIFRAILIAVMLTTPLSALSVDDNASGARKESCSLYEITLPAHWVREYPVDASGMPPVRGALLLDAVGGETKCHLSYQVWKFFDKKHYENSEHCSIQSYILPKGGKVDIEFLKAMIDRQNTRPGTWKKIEHGYMKSEAAESEGFKVGAKGPEKVIAYDRFIDVLVEGSKYVHHLSINVPEERYRSDAKYRRAVDNVWKAWRLKK